VEPNLDEQTVLAPAAKDIYYSMCRNNRSYRYH